MKKIIFFLVLSILTWSTYAQKKTYDFESMDKNAVSISLLGATPFFGVSYERILSEHLSVEAGLGIVSAGMGLKAVPFGIRPDKFTFHTGLTIWYFLVPDLPFSAFYLPVGFSYYGKRFLNISFDIGPAIYNDADGDVLFGAYLGLKGGFRF